MMACNNYPDVWKIVKISKLEDNVSSYHVFSGSYGGYIGSDTYRFSTPILEFVEKEDHYFINTRSGSTYNLNKGCERFSGYTQNMFLHYVGQFEQFNATLTVSSIEELKERKSNE